MKEIVFVDAEISIDSKSIIDLGAVKENDSLLHTTKKHEFTNFIKDAYFICGHNIVAFDSRYIEDLISQRKYEYIDTLCISPLIYPKNKYHSLLKDDKLCVEEFNNPCNDAIKAKDLFYCEVDVFNRLPDKIKNIFGSLLFKKTEFSGFFEYVKWNKCWNLKKDILSAFEGRICENCNLGKMIDKYPVELAYCLALINSTEEHDIVSPWVQKNYPSINRVMKDLRGTQCSGCKYCNEKFDLKKRLKQIFGYPDFRKYNDEPLQENAVKAAVDNKSLLAVFPTGGGKSITFQLPALIEGDATKSLTVVISPLQSLMKDQVDGLERRGLSDAVTINGMLDPISRAEAIDRVNSGKASLLYISPELLRSKTIETMLLGRNIARIVIDEAHCFSAWGQDFRVDYLYIAEFINKLQEMKNLKENIPVSCFTATAKQKVVSDICDYFKEKLGLRLEIYATTSERANLRYKVELKETEDDKYLALRDLLSVKQCPTIIYTSRTKTTEVLADKLNKDGFSALAFNGKMETSQKVENQEKFIKNDVQIMVATSAFGMGVDKPDVKLVVHYEISDSLENYIQEAGRAGRDQSIQAECVVFYNENDLDKHFMLFNQTKLSMDEIRQIWKGIKSMTSKKDTISCSALELARASGWDDQISDIETRVKTAVAALEASGYVTRGLNSPRVFATSIQVRSLIEVRKIIDKSKLFVIEEDKENAIRIMKALFSQKYTYIEKNSDAESRVDYLADTLGISKEKIIEIIDKLRHEKILADSNDMVAYIKNEEIHRIETEMERLKSLERFLVKYLNDERIITDLKVINEAAINENIKRPSVKNIKTILFFWTIQGYIRKTLNVADNKFEIDPLKNMNQIADLIEKRLDVSDFIFKYLKNLPNKSSSGAIDFSMLKLLESYNNRDNLFAETLKCKYEDIQNALLYLSKMSLLTVEGGFLVLYNAMQIKRLVTDNKKQYKNDDYKTLKEHYELKIQQIHIVGEYANMMVNDYNQALEFVNDYFQLEYDGFIKKYFKGDRKGQIKRTITPAKYNKLFGCLSPIQKKIIDDDESQYITVLAGPGSGKTRVLVHKLASLLLLEDIKSEQLLMLTFSRAAATEFKTRLIDLIGNAAHYIDIKTFHSYCFDLLGKLGNEEEFDDCILAATEMIENGEVEQNKLTKTVLVIDEAQDIDSNEFRLISALMEKNPEMKVIAVGDDDQNIYEFRGSSSKYLKEIIHNKENSNQYELLENYRSVKKIIDFNNAFSKNIKDRMKENPIVHVRKDIGKVTIRNYKTNNLEVPLVNEILKIKQGNKKIAILTQKNEEALRVLGLLNKYGIKAKLIQNDDGFSLYSLAEVRYFIKCLSQEDDSPVISLEVFMEALNKLSIKYINSSALEVVISMIKSFSKVNKVMYRTDFINFIKESKYEDFVDIDKTTVLVSTIHKAKGKEFDIVHILLDNPYLSTDEQKRKLYVGMTRAKDELYIHCNNNSLYKYRYQCEYLFDDNEYEEPDELILQLGHKDVNLNSFKSLKKKNEIFKYLSGNKLEFENEYLYVSGSENKQLFKLSKKANEYIESLKEKEYFINYAEIRFIVAWKDKEDLESNEEYALILPTIYLKKNKVEKPKELIPITKFNDKNIDDEYVEVKININKEKVIEDNKSKEEKEYDYIKDKDGNILTDISLFKKLKSTRYLLAKENEVSPFIVAYDSMLIKLATYKPLTKEEYLKIKGTGEKMYETYGIKLVDVIIKYEQNNQK